MILVGFAERCHLDFASVHQKLNFFYFFFFKAQNPPPWCQNARKRPKESVYGPRIEKMMYRCPVHPCAGLSIPQEIVPNELKVASEIPNMELCGHGDAKIG